MLAFMLMLSGCQAADSPDKETTAAKAETTAAASDTTGEDTTSQSSMLGAPKEAQVSVWVDWSDKKFDSDIEIKVYVDGELDRSKTTVVDSSVTYKNLTFAGRGQKNVKIKLNNETFCTYLIDFDNGTYEKIS